MKNWKLLGVALAACAMGAFTSCSDDKNDSPEESITIKDENGNIQLTIKNPEKWVAAAKAVVADLHEDATEELQEWMTEESIKIKTQAASVTVNEMIDDCIDEVDDVATEKIPSPLAILTTGDDCVANLGSVRNVLLGSLDGTVNEASIMALTASKNPQLAQKISTELADAVAKIQAIPQPLKQNANSTEATAAIAACKTLQTTLSRELQPMFRQLQGDDAALKAIVTQYADGVVTPSVNDAKTAADELLIAVNTLPSQPTEQHIQAVIAAYIKARAALDLCVAF